MKKNRAMQKKSKPSLQKKRIDIVCIIDYIYIYIYIYI